MPDIPFKIKNCRSLWGAVVEQAIKDIKMYGKCNNRAYDYSLRNLEKAQYWLLSDDDDVGSFIWICRELGLNPEYIRKRLLVDATGEKKCL